MMKGLRPWCAWPPAVAGAALLAVFCAARPCAAQAKTPIRIDASQAYSEPGPARYDTGSAKAPSGRVLGVNSRYLTLDGKPWLPVMGEFHFSRFPESQWEEEILKMKAAAVNIVATYVIWIHHEEIEGQFDWKGQRNLRAFAQLCAKHGMYLLPRIGPWAHGEVRNGGFPDWLLKKGLTRVNDPGYLSDVRAWYGQIGQQLNGLLWKDGGPVVGIQLENEYSQRGPGAGEEHILELKRIAIESGLDVPLYLVTGWDNAAVPAGAVIPVFGGYPDAPWDGSLVKLPPSEVYAFRFRNRVGANLGTTGATVSAGNARPFLTAEIGGGNEVTYHRRPVIQPDDIAAMFPVMLGSGVNLYGTYMFQGGENPEGKLTTLQESQATGYPNDVPIKSYDFQAPLGEFGQERASFRKMKVFQYFLNDFGTDLAPMMVHVPDTLPGSPEDFSISRASVRSREDAGFIFFNNYVRGYSMPARPAAQFEIRLPGGTLSVPRHPVDIPSGAYFIWPFNLRIGGVTVRYSTAQLFTRQESGGVTTLYFAAVRGIPAEFVFDASGIRTMHASSGETAKDSGEISVSRINPGVESRIDVVSNQGQRLRVVVLTAQEAEDAWKVSIGGAGHLLISRQDFFADPDTAPGRIWLRSRGTREFAFAITPPLAASPQASLPLTQTAARAEVVRFAAKAAARKPELQCRQIQAPGDAPSVKMGPAPAWRPRGVAQAPSEAELAPAAKWSITVPPQATDGLSGLYLQVRYQGDVARLYSAHHLLTDDFYNGQPWLIGLDRFLDRRGSNTFELSILPLRQDAPVYFEIPDPLSFSPNGQVDKLDSLSLVPEYQLMIGAAAAH
jgi:hypothetical protein